MQALMNAIEKGFTSKPPTKPH